MNTLLPLFYFKPTVCWVDDDQFYLDAVKGILGRQYNCLTFTNPNEAIDFFNSYKSPLADIKLKRELTECDTFGVNGRFPVDFNISEIRKIARNENKSNEIAVLGIDYNMPSMTGIDACIKLQNYSVKKILLTGTATHEKAVQAFNKGLIHKFMSKDIDTSENIEDHVNELANQYFQDQSSNLISLMEASRPTLFSDPIFIEFFNSWYKRHNIVEFYLINKNGCYELIDINNKKYYFLVMSDTNIKEFLQLNNELSNKKIDLLAEVAKGNKIPFFGVGKEAWEFEANDWDTHFYKTEKISSREDYYWTVIEDND